VANCKYSGIPKTRLNGKVAPKLLTSGIEALASGKATETAAGAAM
jgi:hypothetical protein